MKNQIHGFILMAESGCFNAKLSVFFAFNVDGIGGVSHLFLRYEMMVWNWKCRLFNAFHTSTSPTFKSYYAGYE